MNIKATISAASAIVALVASAPARAEILDICEQKISYTIEPMDAQVPEALRAFSGIWVGNWESRICSALVVEAVAADGTVRIIYIHGTVTGPGPLKPGKDRLTGKIVGNKLTAKGSVVSYEYILRSPNELSGKHIASWGTLTGKFSRR